MTFAGAMLGLVLVDDIFSLYLFWELTTVCSFLLVGGDGTTRRSRRSATQALLVTAAGGLAMLMGLILLSTAAGTVRVSEIVADPPPESLLTSVAVILVLAGAFDQVRPVPVPLLAARGHGRSDARERVPTRRGDGEGRGVPGGPVRARLLRDARLVDPVIGFGLWTMILGAVRALRQNDLKTLLAFGTVSQLGFLTVLMGSGGFVSALAGATLSFPTDCSSRRSSWSPASSTNERGPGTCAICPVWGGVGRCWPG